MINPVLNGWICNVGCQTVVFASRDELIKNLDEYLRNPQAVEQRFIETSVNKDMLKMPQLARPPKTEPMGMDTCVSQEVARDANPRR